MAEGARRRALVRRWLRYPLEGAAVWLAFALLGRLSIDGASALGGWLGRSIGPLLPVSRRAERQLRRALPELGEADVARIVRGMWDNLGRVAAEYPHLDRIDFDDGRVEVHEADYVDLLREGRGGIFFSAHFGNWEIPSLFATHRGVAITYVYRAANNPYIERMIQRVRSGVAGAHLAKGAGTALELVNVLRSGAPIGMLADQKLREGIPVPFFGRDAMTAPIIAQLALRYRCPVVPVRVERTGGARFRLTAFPPLEMPDSGDRAADVREAMRRVNAVIEEWVRARPEQWFWLHRRWPD